MQKLTALKRQVPAIHEVYEHIPKNNKHPHEPRDTCEEWTSNAATARKTRRLLDDQTDDGHNKPMPGFTSSSYNVHNASNDEQVSAFRNVNW